MKKAALLDLGNTLVWYYSYEETRQVLSEAIAAVSDRLRALDLLRVTPEQIEQGLLADQQASGGVAVRPMQKRLERIFRLQEAQSAPGLMSELCSCFMQPLLERARLYPDVHPVLEKLRAAGWRLAIVSNSPWGCPGDLWRAEIARHGLLERVDEVVLCTDVGVRKPDPAIFEYTLRKLGMSARESVFAGDDPRWDIAGPQASGMQAVLVDRRSHGAPADAPRVRDLNELYAWLIDWEQRATGGASRADNGS